MKKIFLILYVLLLDSFIVSNAGAADVTRYYYHGHGGSVVAFSSSISDPNTVGYYEPYGSKTEGPVYFGSVGQTGSDFGNNQWFNGYAEDETTGLTYSGSRWYDPKIGRFLSIDSASVNAFDHFTFNRYAYANNNPLKFVDPDGREAIFIPEAFHFGVEFHADINIVGLLAPGTPLANTVGVTVDDKGKVGGSFSVGGASFGGGKEDGDKFAGDISIPLFPGLPVSPTIGVDAVTGAPSVGVAGPVSVKAKLTVEASGYRVPEEEFVNMLETIFTGDFDDDF